MGRKAAKQEVWPMSVPAQLKVTGGPWTSHLPTLGFQLQKKEGLKEKVLPFYG